ncbi:ABC transporter substrate-binding protein [Propioniciclava flava]|uniref:Glycine/betaine ABC transporter n=1 Tax=Propioniciclava flava TaxID=2072026 RepID=A0A4Q2EFN8_9ACTN|nr:ABC transporter substrate-binding protein [Propioniciclava flava]RXW31793.1 glycine/betaine ABC transporter [Propioniciclava flava]
MSPISRRRLGALTALAGLGVVAAGCSTGNPLAPSSAPATGKGSGATVVIGSQQYYSNEIIAELYAQALEASGFTVTRQYQIGQREIYLPELEAGKIDVIPEYSGNLLQYYDKKATATDAAQIATALGQALPKGLRALTAAAASDQDSYTVTKALADQYGLAAIADLTKAPQPVKIAANSEFATRPYGPAGVKTAYGVDLQLVPVEDSGGPLTLRALTDGTVQVADLYTADPSIAKNNLVILSDPKNLILPQNVTPIVSAKVDAKAAAAIEAVNSQLSVADLQQLNARSVDEQAKSADIASAWLKSKGLV